MAITIDKLVGNSHKWEKTNLLTLRDRQGMHDKYKCEKCGMKAKSYALSTLTISLRYNEKAIFNCPKADPLVIPKKVRVKNIHAVGRIFENLKPGTVRDVVDPPKGYENNHLGVWVMGVGEQVKMLKDEYEALPNTDPEPEEADSL